MSKNRFSLEEINNMSAETMRQILRDRELEAMQEDKATAEKDAKKLEDEKFFNDYFKERLANQHPKFHDQY